MREKYFVLTLVLMLLVMSTAAMAQPSQPAVLYGYVNFTNGSGVGAGYNVTAYIDNVQIADINSTNSISQFRIAIATGNYSVGDNVTLNVSQGDYAGSIIETNISQGSQTVSSYLTITDSVAPSAVSGLTATPLAQGTAVNLSWSANGGDTNGYKVYRNGTLIATLTGISNVTTTATGLTNGLLYSFSVSAYDSEPNYATNATATATPQDTLAPAQVTGLAVAIANQTVNLTWNAVTNNSDGSAISDLGGYYIYSNMSGTWGLLQYVGSGTSYDNNTLTNDVTYHFMVSALDGSSNFGANSSIESGAPTDRPSINLVSPASATYVQAGTVLNFSVTSPILDNVWYSIDASSSIPLADPYDITATTVPAIDAMLLGTNAETFTFFDDIAATSASLLGSAIESFTFYDYYAATAATLLGSNAETFTFYDYAAATAATLLGSNAETFTFYPEVAATAATITGTNAESFVLNAYAAAASATLLGSNAETFTFYPEVAPTSATITGTVAETFTFSPEVAATAGTLTGTVAQNYTFTDTTDATPATLVSLNAENFTFSPEVALTAATVLGSGSESFIVNSSKNVFNVTINGTFVQNFTINDSTYTAAELVSTINGNTSNLTATDVGGQIRLTIDGAGSAGGLTIGGTTLMTYLGFTGDTTTNGTDYNAGNETFIVSVNSGANVSFNFTPSSTALSAANVSSQIQTAVAGLNAADNGTGYIELTTAVNGDDYNITIGSGTANAVLGFSASQSDIGTPEVAGNETFIVSVDGGANVNFNFTTGSALTATQVAAEIQAAVAGITAVNNGSNFVKLTSNTTGVDSNVTIGSGTANAGLGFSAAQTGTGTALLPGNETFVVSADGAGSVNFNFTPTGSPLTAAQVAAQIQAAVDLTAVDNGTGYIELTSNTTGTSSSISIGTGTANVVLGFSNIAYTGADLVAGNETFVVVLNSSVTTSFNFTPTGVALSAANVSAQITSAVSNLTAADNGTGYIELTTDAVGADVNVTIGSGTANIILGFGAAQNDSGTNVVPNNREFLLDVNGVPLALNLTAGSRSAAQVASDINTAFGATIASDSSGNVTLTSNMTGVNSNLTLGTGTANAVLGFTNGQEYLGTDLVAGNETFVVVLNSSVTTSFNFTPTGVALSAANVSAQITSAVSNLTAADNGTGYIELTTDAVGADVNVTIGSGTANIILGFGAAQNDSGTNVVPESKLFIVTVNSTTTSYNFTPTGVALSAANVSAQITAAVADLTAADNGTGYIELSTDSTGVAANITIGAGNANTKLGFVATQNDTGFNMIPESKLFIISVDGGANVSLNFTPTNTTLTAAQVAAQIQAAVAGLTAVDNGTGYIELTSNTTGLGSNMTVGAGNANSVLGFSASQSDVGTPFMDVNNKTFYVSVNGVDYNFNFTPTNTALSADNVSTQINNAVFAAFAADNGTGYIELVSNITGADSNITIGDGTANDVLGFTNTQNDMGMNGTWVNAYTYILRLYANDTNSVTSNENYTITIDNDNPVVSGSVFSDADDLVTSSTAVVLNVTASDAISPISTVTAGVVGTEVSMSNVAGSLYTTSTTNASALGCSEGSCVVKFVATDSAENVNNTHTYTFTVDDTNPALSGATISDADDEVRETDTIQVNVTVTDSNGVSTVSVNGQSMNHMGSNIYNYTGTALSLCGATDGTCTLTFLATDNALRTNTLTYNLTTDDTNPVISSVTISDSYVQDTTSVSVTVAVTDAHTSVASVTAEGTTLIDRGSGIWNGTISLNDTAVDAVNVLAIDNVGNRHTLNTTTYTIDDSAPTYASSSLTDDYVTNATQVQWLVNVLDSNLSSYTLTTYDLGAGSISGSSFVANNVTLNLSVTLTAETKNVTLVVIDGAENTLTLALINGTNFTVDDANPIVNSVAISDDYIKSTQSVTFTVNVSGESNTSLASVTAEGNALAWTGTAWVGTGTTDSDEVINVSVTDKAGNVGTHSSSVYTVDNVVPVFTVVVPLQGYNYTNAAGNITINFTLTEANVSIFNVSIDGTRNYTGTTAGTHTNTFVGLRTGWHNATFRATDEAGNLAVVVRKSFRIVAPLNVSQAAAGLNTSLGARNVSFSVSNVSVTGNGSLTVDDTTVMTMDMEYNLSGTEIDVQIPEFDALDASWENTFTAETNESSGSSVTASGNAGSTIQKIVLFKNASGFLSQSDFTRGARITFKQAIQGLDILYLDDDEGNTVYKLSACTSVPTSAITTSNMCYVNTTTNVTLYIPHFSGGAIANDTAAPAVTITSVSNSSTIADSSFWINFTANEANPHATTFCNYTLNNGSVNTYSNVDIDAIAAEMSSVGTAWSYSQELYTLVNGTYTLTVVCKDANLAENSTVYALTVADSTAPIITATGPSGDLESSSSTYTATLSATTDEKTLCRYSETSGAYASMTEALGSANTYATTHTESISHTEDEDVTYYIACTDKNGNEDAATVTYSVDVTERSSSSDNTVVTTTPGLITYSKSWLSINAGEEKITAVDRDGMAFTQVVFTAKNDISSASMTLKVLTGAPTSTGAISKEAYQYIQLLETNFDSEDITNAKINFKVEKSWLTSKGLSENNVALYRYVNGKWVAQTTEMKASDVTHVFYEANVGGFSYFAIGQAETEAPVVPDVVPAVVVPEVQTPPPTGDVVQEVVDDQETTGSSDESKMSSGKWLWVAIVIVVVIILAFLFFREGKIQLVGKKAEKEGLNKTSNVKSMNDFIEKQLAAGHKKSDVKAALLQVGWPKDKVEEALKKVK